MQTFVLHVLAIVLHELMDLDWFHARGSDHARSSDDDRSSYL
jgi:hypothetical protein